MNAFSDVEKRAGCAEFYLNCESAAFIAHWVASDGPKTRPYESEETRTKKKGDPRDRPYEGKETPGPASAMSWPTPAFNFQLLTAHCSLPRTLRRTHFSLPLPEGWVARLGPPRVKACPGKPRDDGRSAGPDIPPGTAYRPPSSHPRGA